jgi:heme A synthase
MNLFLATLQGAASESTREPISLAVLLAIFAALALLTVGWAALCRPINLAVGLGATVAMWVLSFVALLQPGLYGGELLFAGAALCAVAGGFVAGKHHSQGGRGLSAGLVCGAFNLMVVGAFLGEQSQSSQAGRALYAAGLLASTGVLGAIGGMLGRNAASKGGVRDLNPAVVATAVTAAAIFAMIVLGGLVTSMEAGLAVPDWPNSFGHNMLLYPIAEMRGGVFYEHSHRLFGMLVGAATLACIAVVFKCERRALPRALVLALLALVVVQGILGGLRVTGQFTTQVQGDELRPSAAMGIAHGMLGQAVFALAVILPLSLTRLWDSAVPALVRGARSVRGLPRAALALLVVQLFLGVAMRHLQVPPTGEEGARIPAWALHGHITMAIIVAVVAVLAGLRCSQVRALPTVSRNGKAVMHTVGLQLVLGIFALVAVLVRRGEAVPWWEAGIATAHQAVGALLLALTAMLVAQTTRLVSAEEPQAATGPAAPA